MSLDGSYFARVRSSMAIVAGILSATVWSATAFGADKITVRMPFEISGKRRPAAPAFDATALAAADVDARRGYLWIAGVLAKGLGAALFVADHVLHASPASFLLFVATDGTLALVTLVLLLRRPRPADA